MAAKKRVCFIFAFLSGAVLIASLIQIFFLGLMITLPFIAMSFAGMLIALRWDSFKSIWLRLRKNLAVRIFTNALIALIAVAALVFTVISGLMVHAITVEPPSDDAVLIVLGARVNGYTPSLILQLRLEAALEYLNNNPESVGILTGGLGSRAYISEAESMKRWLVANGICESRLFLEDRSTSTYENITFAKIIMDEHGLSHNVAIASDGFHMFRAQHFARRAGLIPGAVPSRTPLRALPYYWLREVIAILFWARSM